MSHLVHMISYMDFILMESATSWGKGTPIYIKVVESIVKFICLL